MGRVRTQHDILEAIMPVTKVVTLAELAADASWHPQDDIPLFRDPRPHGFNIRPRAQVRAHTQCRVVGCGVAYSPGGVCGYCRYAVRVLRSGRATGQTGAV